MEMRLLKTHLLFLHLYLLLLLFSPTLSYNTDMETLLNLKSSMTGPNGAGLHDWLHSTSPTSHCSFSGVTCNSQSRVISLNISFTPLFGTISPEIGNLNHLVNLTLAANNFSGNLPTSLKNLTSLKILNISNNGNLNGTFPGEIFIYMTNLEVLDAYNNNFTGTLPLQIPNLKKLKHLSLGGNFFTGEIPITYGDIETLEYLGLNGAGLSGDSPSFLSKLKNLKEMYIGYYNSYTGGVPKEFGGLTNLEVLDMASCTLTGEIPTSLSNLKQLHTLFLHINNLTGLIPQELSGLISLKSLDLSINRLTGEIPASFISLGNITLINLFRNNLYGQIPSFIGELPKLQVFEIWENNFTLTLPESLGRNRNLKKLDVSANHLTGVIPKDLCKGEKLEMLILSNNFLFGPIPEELGQCKSLNKIRIVKNLLNGTIPRGLFNLPLVTIIELTDNFFSGELPITMSGDVLDQIYLSNNWFTGEIPSAIGNFERLQTLSLDRNRFRGEIPKTLFELNHLTKVNISGNNLTGEIPGSISRCTSLNSVDLSRNRIGGEIPKEINQVINLGTLNLSGNQLTGVIPTGIGNMTSLTTLDLSYNDLSGRVPLGGQFMVFNDTSFEGNRYLCLPHRVSCSMRLGQGLDRDHTALFTPTRIVITVIAAITALVLIGVAIRQMNKNKNEKSLAWKLTAFRRLDFKSEDVLECLKEENIIGKGGAGIVYRGSMANNVDVAIKRLVGRGTGRSDHGFTAEIQTLGRIRHRHIVRLLGYVANKDTNLLLYEYMPNGSLGELLHGSKGGHLQWETRRRVAVEAAKGLCYLHHDCSPLILHRDVKSNNILLDSDFEAHVADFGLAKFLVDGAASECMSSIAGSYGYIAPEYAYTLKVDEKSDVYSFGVVLLELIAGKKPVGEFGEGVDIVRWVRNTEAEISPQPSDVATVVAIIDPRLTGYPLACVVHVFKIAMMCVEDESTSRPTMREVVHMLRD
ncbi:hypothetical protein AALP_AA2G201900 [Arabis alpina]|uniref:non-specific serine/threonine protein kinase n=1 Tax=Arabis alpina TaxID=50452 RepID=A0A087HIR8_ARAAL|nr:hypothetical protein AALP_AA2G201900 [Arabis alpina]